MSSAHPPPAIQATFAVGEERAASRVVDVLTESYPNPDIAIAAFETADGRWDVTMHFAQAPDEDAVRALVAVCAGDAAAKTIVFETVAAKDWIAASLEGLAPVDAGRFMVHGAHDRARVPRNRIGIEIEAALAFGTGHHGTTRGCLLLLDEVLRRRRPRRVLDLGCGTGVLAIAAAKALRQGVLASDIDPRAAIVARDNARLNGAGNLVAAICATGFSSPRFSRYTPFDLVLANILAKPLQRLATPMAAHLAPGALVILSGLLPHHANGVITAYRANSLHLVKKIQIEGWTSLLMNRG